MRNILVIALLCFCDYSFSQITITSFDKKAELKVLKPPQYDSLKEFESYDYFKSGNQFYTYDPKYPPTEDLYYKQYIGLKIFYPPCENERFTTFFSNKPSFIRIDKPIDGKDIDSLMTFQYKPIFIYSGTDSRDTNAAAKIKEYDSRSIDFYTKCSDLGNKYYTIIDFLNKDSLINLRDRMGNAINYDTLKQRKIYQEYINDDFVRTGIGFLLKDDISGDTLYSLGSSIKNSSSYFSDGFILVPYFVKQKQMFDGKTFVALTKHAEDSRHEEVTFKDLITNKDITLEHGSKWKCEVTLLDYNKANKNNLEHDEENNLQNYAISYVFRSGEKTISLFDMTIIPYNSIVESSHGSYTSYAFKLADVYANEENLKRLKKDELIARQKKVEQSRMFNERAIKEKFRNDCIDKFGQENGNLIAQGKIKIGMTSEMCETAWGMPFDSYKTTTVSNITENWYYGWKRSLHFFNGILIRIDE
jgi:hypothetical protein